MRHARTYRYVGPDELRNHIDVADAASIDTLVALAGWLARRERSELDEPFTYVVALDGTLRLAPRRCEHVTLADGRDVLAAGEIKFTLAGSGWRVAEVTNQSTGYCPDPDCWPAVGGALERLGVAHPADFTGKVIFRRCPTCGQRNIVKDNDFTCALCDGRLPAQWNFASA